MAQNCELGTTDLGSNSYSWCFCLPSQLKKIYPHQIGSYIYILQIVKTKETPIFDTLKSKVAQLQCVGLKKCGPFASLLNLEMVLVLSSFLTWQHFHIKSRVLFSKKESSRSHYWQLSPKRKTKMYFKKGRGFPMGSSLNPPLLYVIASGFSWEQKPPSAA